MGILNDKLLKVASDIDSLIDQISKEVTEQKRDEIDQVKIASREKRSNSNFGTVSDYSDNQTGSAENQFLSKILN